MEDKYFVPDSSYSVNSRLTWLAGYLDGDGTVARNGTNESLQATSINHQFLYDIQKMLQELGVHSKVVKGLDAGYRDLPLNDGSGKSGKFYCQETLRILISSSSLYKLSLLGLKCNRLTWDVRKPQRNAEQFIKIVDVIDEGVYEDTYCFTEPKRHMGMFNGILTGQCQEIGLPTAHFNNVFELEDPESGGEVGLCSLAAIVVSRITSDEEYEKLAYITAKTIDNTIENMVYPYKQVEYTAKARRSIGVGMTDLATLLAKEGLLYSSQEGRTRIHEIAERHSYYLHKASVELAKERGACEWFSKTKYADGWLPIDSYNKPVDEYHDATLKYDWEGLRTDMLKYGMRFSVLEAIAPNESSSVLTNTCNSIYPVRSKDIFKSSTKGMVYFYAENWDTYTYEKAYDINELDLVKVYSIIQKFVGQSISSDFYTKLDGNESKISVKGMLKRVLLSVKLGMKTYYYENFMTDSEEEIVLDDASCEGCKL